MRSAALLFHRLILRALLRDRLRTTLTVLTVALGVGVVIAIELAGAAAAGSFRSSMETLASDVDLEVTAIGGVDEQVLGRVASLPWPLRVSSRVEGYAVRGDTGATVALTGLDLLQHQHTLERTEPEEALDQMRAADSIWVTGGLGLDVGDVVALTINGRIGDFTVRGVIDEGANAESRAIIMDIGAAQQALRKPGRLDRIEIHIPSEDSAAQWIERIREVLPADAEVRPQGARREENQKMLSAFRWNLRVLSYISLVVGAFLIYNTIAVSVVRRRTEIGILRALGVTRIQVVAAFLAEAALFGMAGGFAGIALGRLMAEGAVGLLAATVNSLYVSSTPAPMTVTPGIVALALVIGIIIALASALAPALEAAQVAPADAMARGRRDYITRRNVRRNLALAAVLALAAFAASRVPPVAGKPLFGYLATLLLIASTALAIPGLITALSHLWQPALRRVLGIEGMLGARSVAVSLTRTAVLVGALATSVAMMTSVGIMVGSFRETVSLWLDNQLQADLYVRPAGGGGANRQPTLSAEIADKIESVPGVAAVDRFRVYNISYEGRPAFLGAGQTEWIVRYGRTSFLPGQDREAILTELPRGDNVIVSEPFANKHGVGGGDVLRLPLGGEDRTFRVLGVYRDFSNERGYIIMDRGTMLRYLPDAAATSLAIYLGSGSDLDRMRNRVESAITGHDVILFTNRSLREEAMRIFDRTFAITYALEAVAVAVAVMGIAGALLAMVIDRRREMSVLRFLGASTTQIRKLILCEAGLLGLLSTGVGLGLGFLLSLILIFVINRQSFGWTIEFHLPVALLAAGLTGVYASTILAGLYPARIAARLNPIEGVHEE